MDHCYHYWKIDHLQIEYLNNRFELEDYKLLDFILEFTVGIILRSIFFFFFVISFSN